MSGSRVYAREPLSTLHRDADAVARMPEIMFACGVEDAVIERLTRRCNDIAADLRVLKG